MIQAANLSFAAVNELEFGLPIWKYYTTPLAQKLYDAQDLFTEYFQHILLSFHCG